MLAAVANDFKENHILEATHGDPLSLPLPSLSCLSRLKPLTFPLLCSLFPSPFSFSPLTLTLSSLPVATAVQSTGTARVTGRGRAGLLAARAVSAACPDHTP